MNIELRTVAQAGKRPTRQATSGPRLTMEPGLMNPNSRPGIAPYWHTDASSTGLCPIPCTASQTSRFTPIRR